MAQAQRSQGLRLGVDFEANALIVNLGREAYSAACLRAEEASNEDIARDWSHVANVIARKARRSPGLMAPGGALPGAVRPDWPFT